MVRYLYLYIYIYVQKPVPLASPMIPSLPMPRDGKSVDKFQLRFQVLETQPILRRNRNPAVLQSLTYENWRMKSPNIHGSNAMFFLGGILKKSFLCTHPLLKRSRVVWLLLLQDVLHQNQVLTKTGMPAQPSAFLNNFYDMKTPPVKTCALGPPKDHGRSMV